MDHHAIVIADQDGVIRVWSDGAARLIGHAAADAVGQKLDLIVPPDFRARFTSLIWRFPCSPPQEFRSVPR